METKLTKLLGIQYPIIQGGMAWCSSGKLAAAVSNAGGAGIVGQAVDAPWVREQVRRAKTLTDKPFGVNLPMLSPFRNELMQIAIDEKVAFVTIGAGKPTPEMVQRFKDAGIKIISVVPTLRAAKGCEALGVDAIVVEGMEAGGHIGDLTTMVLMTEVIPEIQIPVVAAGGFSDGRGLAAALVMGACGVQIGTAFLCAEECEIHNNAKQKILDSISTDVTITGSVRKKTNATRGIKSRFSEKYHELEDGGAAFADLADLATGTNRKALVDGDVENGFVMAGQGITTLKAIRPAKDIIEGICSEAQTVLAKAPALLG